MVFCLDVYIPVLQSNGSEWGSSIISQWLRQRLSQAWSIRLSLLGYGTKVVKRAAGHMVCIRQTPQSVDQEVILKKCGRIGFIHIYHL